MELTLIRTYYEQGTNGSLHIVPFLSPVCYTIELPWRNNEKQVSCIPEGRYALQTRYTEKYKQHLVLVGVEGRSGILIHPANNALSQLKGCIAPVRKLTGEGKGSDSGATLQKVLNLATKALEKEAVFITIKSIQYDNKGKITGANATVL